MKMDQRGFTLVEIMISITVGAIVAGGVIFSLFNYRNNVQYDVLVNRLISSINFVNEKARSGVLDSSEQKVSYGVKFFTDRFVEFEGATYLEGDDKNVQNVLPVGYELNVTCVDDTHQEVVFSQVSGENSNPCTINILRWGQTEPITTIIIGKYGIESVQKN